MEFHKMPELRVTARVSVTTNEERRYHNSRGGNCEIHEIERFQRFLSTENIAIVVYNFSTFGRGENPLYDGRALLASLGREHSYCLHIMYYERSRHYNPILSLKAVARGGYCVSCNMGYRNGRSHRCSKKCPPLLCHTIVRTARRGHR